MLVYGDPKFEAPLDSLHRELCARVRQALERPDDLDRLRALLIACGQVEQGAHDALERVRPRYESELLARLFHEATAHAAAAFYSLAHKELGLLPPPLVDASTALQRMLQRLDSMTSLPDLAAAIKLPEGFNLHALYPEQYAVAAGRWLADHHEQRAQLAAQGSVVVGIRSIGTTLAAVVATVLRAGGWQVQSFTVRPQGHPYARTVELEGMQFAPAALGLVIDEGPGISGSSMAATAAALVKAGLAPEGIAFFPGHANEPGGAGAPEVQRWWQMAPRYVGDGEELTFGGRRLPEALAAAVGMQPARIDNVSGGVWRQHVYPHPEDWPAVCNQFERVKYLCTAEDGSRVLFKFYGLAASSPSLTSAAEAAAALLQERAAHDLATPVRGVAYGFVATEWLEGTPLRSEAPPPDMAETLGAYIARAAGPQLTASELAEANARLADMIYVNTREACGEHAADMARQLGLPAVTAPAVYGDGHMQPYEWLCCANGELRKVDGAGHASDHTLIGKQPVAWDIAGAVVEWQLDPSAAKRLLQAFCLAGGAAIDAGTLKFYQAAYLAFRAGQCALAAQMHDPYESERLLAAYGAYRQRLAEQLG